MITQIIKELALKLQAALLFLNLFATANGDFLKLWVSSDSPSKRSLPYQQVSTVVTISPQFFRVRNKIN